MGPLIWNGFLLFWSQITCTHHMKWSSWIHNELILSYHVLIGGVETLLAGLGLKNCSWFSEYEPGVLFTFWFKIQADVLALLHTVHSMDLPRMLERLDFADFRILWGWLQVCVPIFPFFSLNVHVREMMESHSELCLVIPLYFLQLHLAFIIRWNVNCNRCRISLVHQQI